MIKHIVLKYENEQVTTNIAAMLSTTVTNETVILTEAGRNIYLNITGTETNLSEIVTFKPEYIKALYTKINTKTDNFLKIGFTWNNILFSLDQEHLNDYRDTVNYLKAGVLQYPYEIKGSNNQSTNLTADNIDSFFTTGLTYKETITKEGWTIKTSLSEKTELELLNFVDPRN